MLFVLKYSMSFSVSHNHVTVTYVTSPSCFVTCGTITHNVILYSLSKFKIKKSKNET